MEREPLITPADIPFCSYKLNNKTFLLTIDIETDFGSDNYEALSQLDRLLDLVQELEIPLTAFVEGRFFETQNHICKMLKNYNCDVQLHCYDHRTDGDTPELLRRSVDNYSHFMGALPRGYRAHTYRLTKQLCCALMDCKINWDSSILPAFGQGGNLHKNFREGDYLIFADTLMEFPIATWRRFSLPLNHSYRLLFKPFGETLLRWLDTPSTLATYNMHMVDLVYCRSLKNAQLHPFIKLLYLYMWGWNRKDTFDSLRRIVSYFLEHNYNFSKPDTLFNELNSLVSQQKRETTR